MEGLSKEEKTRLIAKHANNFCFAYGIKDEPSQEGIRRLIRNIHEDADISFAQFLCGGPASDEPDLYPNRSKELLHSNHIKRLHMQAVLVGMAENLFHKEAEFLQKQKGKNANAVKTKAKNK